MSKADDMADYLENDPFMDGGKFTPYKSKKPENPRKIPIKEKPKIEEEVSKDSEIVDMVREIFGARVVTKQSYRFPKKSQQKFNKRWSNK